MSVYYEVDLDPSPLEGKAIAVVGYGNQGRAQALNLRDRGLDVKVGARPGRGREAGLSDGFEVRSISDAVAGSELVLLTIPDEAMAMVFDREVAPSLTEGAVLCFAHGFAVTYGLIKPPYGGILVSASGPGTAVRDLFVEGEGVPGFVAAEPVSLMPLAKAFALAIGCGRGGVVETTFREETECDLFGEQVVLCGGMPELAVAAYETLVESGYTPEVAYTECIQQVRLLADLMARYGVAGMKKRISDTAEWGSYATGPKIVDSRVRERMAEVLAEIVSGQFAEEWISEAHSGKKTLESLRESQGKRGHEAVFRRLSRSD